MVQGLGAGLDVKVQGEGAGLDEKEQGMGVGLDKKVQTKPIVIPKNKYKDAMNANIHAKPKEQGDNQAKPKEQEDNKNITGCKRPIAESRGVARVRN